MSMISSISERGSVSLLEKAESWMMKHQDQKVTDRIHVADSFQERMQQDEQMRNEYENLLASAAMDVSHLGKQLQTLPVKVNDYGLQIDEEGTPSFFAVLQKAGEGQRNRIERMIAKAVQKEVLTEKSNQKAELEALYEARRETNRLETPGFISLSARSSEELFKKVQDYSIEELSNHILSPRERALGQNLDFSI
ncbi:MAG: DUF6033 family protein [Lachnospiraceae bacterium]|nr:DUF6033 family protein [Lachnospiraceae bacterium]